MRVDETGKHDHPLCIDDRRARHLEILAYRRDLAIPDMNVTAGNIAQYRIHRHDVGVSQQQLAALRQHRFSALSKKRARGCCYTENSNKLSSVHGANDYSRSREWKLTRDEERRLATKGTQSGDRTLNVGKVFPKE